METDNNKNKKILIVISIVFVILTIALIVVKQNLKKENKALSQKDYIIAKETDYSDKENKGLLPKINLKGKDIEKINNEIITNYYNVAYTENDIYSYDYSTYKNVLSLYITIVYVDNSEYGRIEYYAYNINTDTNEVLSNKELLKVLSLDEKEINEKINKQLKKYYHYDELNKTISFDDYKKAINYNDKNNKYIIKNNTLYCYNSLNTTKSLLTYQGNINEFVLTNLK